MNVYIVMATSFNFDQYSSTFETVDGGIPIGAFLDKERAEIYAEQLEMRLLVEVDLLSYGSIEELFYAPEKGKEVLVELGFNNSGRFILSDHNPTYEQMRRLRENLTFAFYYVEHIEVDAEWADENRQYKNGWSI